ncbi:glycoside hydrolase family 43 protein [Nocardiopsis ansamitocini]|uniref:Glycoside hydrolase 43 family protein n=1 Tax=Nocardiopsis ansamitocini TaxID=1670832 RepID=A0A9W6P7Q7_9ACTN|nr:glycoside hydrolase family 43 protein [Nocardiopsis ansamitocini]GLU48597.1 glycoside hydrolase 43 family protein [Nocardiopsis ansamitocini]
MTRSFRNPVLSGFHPDPSVCRVGDDYYLVTSTFEYFPGLPVHHSRDLVHWRILGHALDRSDQLDLSGIRCSGGLYAPTIRHHEGRFYLVCTLVDGTAQDGSFVLTATDPAGPWSGPHWIQDAHGIDPSLFFDDDGSAWWTGCREAADPQWPGQTEIWLRRFDAEEMRLTGPEHVLWTGALRGGVWAEGPHLYRVDGHYLLITAEGGTEHNHSVMAARSASITGPYLGNPRNPVLTHRHLGLDHPVVGVGHADLVRTQRGEWWALLLASRSYGGYHHTLGRETFLTRVQWEEGWPLLAPGAGRLEPRAPAPDLAPHPWPPEPVRDDFDAPGLAPVWNGLRTPAEPGWSLSERPGHLRLRALAATLAERASPAFVGQRLRHRDFRAAALVDFVPRAVADRAGLALLRADTHHVLLVVTRADDGAGRVLSVLRRAGGPEEVLARAPVPPGPLVLAVHARGQDYRLSWARPGEPPVRLACVDGRVLSTQSAGGFTGAYVGLYAHGDGTGAAHADIDWFDYEGRSG